MQIAIVIGLVGLSLTALAWRLARKLGIGTKGGKPDCGCGHCND